MKIPPMSKEEKRRKLMSTVALSLSTFISVLFLIFAFTKKLEADDLRKEADKQTQIAKENLIESQRQEKLAKEAKEQADIQRALALQALEDCKRGKR